MRQNAFLQRNELASRSSPPQISKHKVVRDGAVGKLSSLGIGVGFHVAQSVGVLHHLPVGKLGDGNEVDTRRLREEEEREAVVRNARNVLRVEAGLVRCDTQKAVVGRLYGMLLVNVDKPRHGLSGLAPHDFTDAAVDATATDNDVAGALHSVGQNGAHGTIFFNDDGNSGILVHLRLVGQCIVEDLQIRSSFQCQR